MPGNTPDRGQIRQRAARISATRTRSEIRRELADALGWDEPPEVLTKSLMANHIAVLEVVGIDQRTDTEKPQGDQ